MAISLQRSYFEASRSHLRIIDTKLTREIISPKNAVRRSGLIINQSKYDLLVWFGSAPPANDSDWIEISSRANCDIPQFFTGEIYGFWRGDDKTKTKIYEFYGE